VGTTALADEVHGPPGVQRTKTPAQAAAMSAGLVDAQLRVVTISRRGFVLGLAGKLALVCQGHVLKSGTCQLTFERFAFRCNCRFCTVG
jgi:hypothetical protein